MGTEWEQDGNRHGSDVEGQPIGLQSLLVTVLAALDSPQIGEKQSIARIGRLQFQSLADAVLSLFEAILLGGSHGTFAPFVIGLRQSR